MSCLVYPPPIASPSVRRSDGSASQTGDLLQKQSDGTWKADPDSAFVAPWTAPTVATRLNHEIWVGDPIIPTTKGKPFIDAVDYCNGLAVACTLVVPKGAYTVNEDVTAASTVHVVALKGCDLQIAATQALTGTLASTWTAGGGNAVFTNGAKHVTGAATLSTGKDNYYIKAATFWQCLSG